MRRRDFVALVGAAAAWPLTARAQQPARIPVVGYLSIDSAAQHAFGGADVFQAGLADLGYVEGKNIHIEFRFAERNEDRLPAIAAELVALKVDVIVTYATGIFAAFNATKTIPIVMAVGPDLVAVGVVPSLAHPGGNVTGLTFFLPELMAKRLELLKQVVPSLTAAGVLLVRDIPTNDAVLPAMAATAKALGVELHPIFLREPREFDSDFFAASKSPIGGFVMIDHSLYSSRASAIAALAANHRLPGIGPLALPSGGGLLGYGVNFKEMFYRSASIVDKILKGAQPGDIPIEQATKFLFVINLKTAKALDIKISPNLLSLADDAIE